MRFFVRIRGARTPPPNIEEPVMNIPLRSISLSAKLDCRKKAKSSCEKTYHPAPNTLNPIHNPIPVAAHANGLDSSRNRPMLNASPDPIHHQVQVGLVLSKSYEQLVRGSMEMQRSRLACEEQVQCNDDDDERRQTVRVVRPVVAHLLFLRARACAPALRVWCPSLHSRSCKRTTARNSLVASW